MLKKMFKTILVFSLCIGVVLPTNAAVSVSDGSAFVTKAEFAADLNNLSNRMAQLENSLDAKIDSLVSSYLTRNGIWNGAKQELQTYYIVDNINGGNTLSSFDLTNGQGYFAGETGTYTATNTSWLAWPTGINTTYKRIEVERVSKTIVQSVNKSGLLYMTVNFSPLTQVMSNLSDARSHFNIDGDGQAGSTIGRTVVEWLFSFYVNDTNNFSSIDLLYKANPSEGLSQNAAYLTFSTYASVNKILTFVSKGDKLSVKDFFTFKRNSAGGNVKQYTYNGELCPISGCVGDYIGYIMTIDDCVVY